MTPELVPSRNPFQLPEVLKETLRKKQEEIREAQHQKELARQKELDRQNQLAQGTLVPTESQASSLELQGILWGDSPRVIINRKILAQGDTANGITIVAIRKDGATVSFQGNEITLELPIKQRESPRRIKKERESR